MDTWTLENETLRLDVDPETFRCSVTRKSSGLQWAFQDNPEGDLRIVHGSTDTLAHLRDAREKQVYRYSTPTEERLTCHLRGLPGGVGLSISYVLADPEDMLRIEVEPLPTTSASHISHVWYPGRLDPVDDETAVHPLAARRGDDDPRASRPRDRGRHERVRDPGQGPALCHRLLVASLPALVGSPGTQIRLHGHRRDPL